MSSKYTPEQHEWLRENYPHMTNADLAKAFTERFGTYMKERAAKSYGGYYRIFKSERLRQKPKTYTQEQLDFLREYIPGHSTAEIVDEFQRRYGVTLTRNMITVLTRRLGVKRGVFPTRFKAGCPSPNRGKTWDEMGISKEGQEVLRKNLFKPGERNSYTEEHMHSLLDTLERKDGVLMIYVRPRNAKFPAQNWISYARFAWMQHNGREWPEGHRVMFADHDNRNFSKENVVAVPDELAIIVYGSGTRKPIPYSDRQTLEAAIAHARLVRARVAAEERLRNTRRTSE